MLETQTLSGTTSANAQSDLLKWIAGLACAGMKRRSAKIIAFADYAERKRQRPSDNEGAAA
jgi:hypothetical protein